MMNSTMVRFREARKKSAMAFVGRMEVSQEDTTGGLLWRESLDRSRSLGSHDAAGLVGGMCYDKGYRQETTRLHCTLYSARRQDGVLSLTIECSTRHSLDPLARAKSSSPFKRRGPSDNNNELADKTADETFYQWTSQRKRGQASTTTPSRALSLRNLISGYECGRVFPAGVGPGSPSRDAANWLPSRSVLSVETRRQYGWLRMVFSGVRLFRAPIWWPSGGWRHARGREHCRGEPGGSLSDGYAPDLAKAEGSSIVDEPGEG